MLKTDQKLTIIAKATEEFLAEVRAAEDRSISEIIQHFGNKYPEIEGNIAELFPALVGVENVARHLEPEPVQKPEFPVFEDYEIIREIGRGGMGVVYQARQKSLDRDIALKVFGLDTNRYPKFLERFHREAQIAASLHHTNIVPVFEIGLENGIHFFSMQYIDGVNLADLCKYYRMLRSRKLESHAPDDSEVNEARGDETTCEFNAARTSIQLPDHDSGYVTPQWIHRIAGFGDFVDRVDQKGVAKIGAQIADALQYIHESGIVHRDIKPANILLDKNGNAWLADWGLVRSEYSDLTQTGDLFGSLAYMAPERFKGKSEPASDIYSLGATLYELVTLERLFQAENQAELVNSIVHHAPLMPRSLDSSISRDFETVILKAIDKQPEARYSTSQKLADDLKNITRGLPVASRRLGYSQRALRWCKKRPVLAAFILLTFFSMLTGTVVSSWFAIRANDATIKANAATELAENRQRQAEDSLDVFFGTFFPQASPDTGAKMSPALRAAMDQAVSIIMFDQRYDAVVVGELFNRMGWVYFNQQDYPAALKLFQHSHERVALQYGEEHVVAMTALDHQGMTVMRLERLEEAEAILERAWQLQSKALGPEHENTIHSMAKLGDLYQRTGDFDRSIEITEKVLRIRSREGRPDAAFVNVSKNGLANAYMQTGKVEKAIALLEEVVADRERNRNFSLGFGYNLSNLARAYRIHGDLNKAEALNDRSLALRVKHLVKSSDSMLSARTIQAGINVDQGELATAEKQLEALWGDAKSTHLPVRQAMVLLEYGRCLQKLERYDDALIHLKSARDLLKKYRSTNNFYCKQAIRSIAEIEAMPIDPK